MPEFGQSEAWLRLQLRLYRRLNRKQSTGAYSPRFVFVLCPFAPGSRVNRNLGWPPQLDGKRATYRSPPGCSGLWSATRTKLCARNAAPDLVRVALDLAGAPAVKKCNCQI